MGYWLNEPAVQDTGLIRKAMEDLGRNGYGIVRFMLRNTNFCHRSPKVVEAMRVAVEAGHAHGLKVVLDSEPHRDPVARDMGREFPEAMSTRLLCVRTRIVNGTFRLRMIAPHTDAQMSIFDGVEVAFLRRDGGMEKIANLSYDLSWEVSHFDTDRCLEQNYEFGRPVRHQRIGKLTGKLDAPEGTELTAYTRVRDIGLVDFWSEGFRKYYEMLLECYRDIPLDGVCWDEPGVGGDWWNYRYGQGFAAAFEKIKGYRLADKIWMLDEPGMTAEAARVRLDYYHMLNEGLALAQKSFIEKAQSLFGKDILLGTHHTWHGEGSINDYRACEVDYFRLTENLDAGYTDCCWWDMDSVCYAYALGSSLGRLTPSGEIECNTWHAKPTNLQVQYNVNLMTLMDITWFNIWYGNDTDTCLYPTHYTWAQTLTSLKQHHRYQLKLAGAKPVTEIGILHGWETVCALNRPEIAGAQKTFCMNTSRLFIERNVPFDFIDTGLIEKGGVSGKELVTALGSYRILVLDFASVLPRGAWARCLEFARAGGKILFVGSPPEMDTDGKSMGEEFAELLQMPRLKLADYLVCMDLSEALAPTRPTRLDVTYPLRGDSARIMTSIEDEPNGIRSPDGNVVYLTDVDPRLRMLNLLQAWTAPEVQCFSETIQWRLYRKDKESFLVCIARKEVQMRGIIRFAGHEIEIKRGNLALITERGGKLEIEGVDLDASVHKSI